MILSCVVLIIVSIIKSALPHCSKLHLQLPCAVMVHPTLLNVFFLMPSEPLFLLVTSAAELIRPSQLNGWPGCSYRRHVSTWQEGSLSFLLCYLPGEAVAHFNASANPSFFLRSVYPPTKPFLHTLGAPQGISSNAVLPACLSASQLCF